MRVPILTDSRRLVSAGGTHHPRTNGVGDFHHDSDHSEEVVDSLALDPANDLLVGWVLRA